MSKSSVVKNKIMTKSKDKDYQIYLLEQELKEYRKLKSELHKGIERVWSIDNTLSPSPEDLDKYTEHLKRNPFSEDYQNKVSQLNKERSEIVEEVFYKIANQWID